MKDLSAQDNGNLQQQFEKAVDHFYKTEYAESREILTSIRDEICESEYFSACIGTLTYVGFFKRNDREYDEAEELLLSAADLADEILEEDDPAIINLYVQIAYTYTDRSEIENADRWADKAVEHAEQFSVEGTIKAKAFVARGYVDDLKGDYRSAIDRYKKGIEEVENLERDYEIYRVLTMAYNNMGISYRRLGRLDDAMRHYLTNEQLVKDAYGENHREMGLVYNSLGSVYYGIGDYGTAADYFEQTALVFRQVHGEENSLVAAGYNNAGLSYIQLGDLERATEMLENAQRIKEQTLGSDHRDTAIGYNNLASVYMQRGELERAEVNYKLSIEVRNNVYGDDHPSLVDPKVQLSRLYMQLEMMDDARSVLSRAEEIVLNRLGEEHPDLLEIYTAIGDTYMEEGELQLALNYYEAVFTAVTGRDYDPEVEGMSDEGVPIRQLGVDIEDVTYPLRLIETLKRITSVLKQFYEEDGNQEYLVEALYLYDIANRTIDHLQTQFQSEASKLNLVDQNYEIYGGAMDVIYRLYEETGDSMWSNLFYEYSETSRSRVALDLLQDLEARDFAGVPDDILQSERDLNAEVASHLQRLNLELDKGIDGDEEVVNLYRDSLFRAQRELREFTQSLEQQYPEYHELKYQRQILPRRDLQEFIASNETVLSYAFGTENLYAIVVRKNSFTVKNLGDQSGISEEVDKLRQSIIDGDTESYSEVAYRLYHTLIEPVSGLIRGRSLTIFPDQALHYLPFESLLTEETAGSVAYHRMPFLVNDFKIQYASSATVLNSTQKRRSPEARNFLGLAPFYDESADVDEDSGLERYFTGFSPLPLSSYETKEISDLFSQRRTFRDFFFPQKTEVLVDRRATKTRMMSGSLEDYSFIHFATHAFVNEENPALSGIALHSGSDYSDGVIYLNDIYNMQMNADLVVLSACDTGLGAVRRGEGLIGFSRAFFYAGASNLVVSMWRVSDQPTSRLMINFYGQILDGNSYGRSIREAKLELISNPETAAPRYWAAFVLNGR
ncbi:MAG: CHAT domain-containing protein [Balneolaceae bacterium]|nr:CHAT domain-containing protein [Balneolaceae bacterium]MCH8547651.1 CHAT domain-containing protein [Balneolaceae bacterium]